MAKIIKKIRGYPFLYAQIGRDASTEQTGSSPTMMIEARIRPTENHRQSRRNIRTSTNLPWTKAPSGKKTATIWQSVNCHFNSKTGPFIKQNQPFCLSKPALLPHETCPSAKPFTKIRPIPCRHVFRHITEKDTFIPNLPWERPVLHFMTFMSLSVRFRSFAGSLSVGLSCHEPPRPWKPTINRPGNEMIPVWNHNRPGVIYIIMVYNCTQKAEKNIRESARPPNKRPAGRLQNGLPPELRQAINRRERTTDAPLGKHCLKTLSPQQQEQSSDKHPTVTRCQDRSRQGSLSIRHPYIRNSLYRLKAENGQWRLKRMPECHSTSPMI